MAFFIVSRSHLLPRGKNESCRRRRGNSFCVLICRLGYWILFGREANLPTMWRLLPMAWLCSAPEQGYYRVSEVSEPERTRIDRPAYASCLESRPTQSEREARRFLRISGRQYMRRVPCPTLAVSGFPFHLECSRRALRVSVNQLDCISCNGRAVAYRGKNFINQVFCLPLLLGFP